MKNYCIYFGFCLHISNKSLTFASENNNNNGEARSQNKSEGHQQGTMKSSKKMEATIAKMEKKYGKLNSDYFVETIESNRVGRGFYDGCTLTCDILKNLYIVVAHDGSYYQF